MGEHYYNYSGFQIHQPFFSFDVAHYQQKHVGGLYSALFYSFSTYKTIDRSNELFMTCIPDGCIDVVFIYHNHTYKIELIGSPFVHKSLIVYPDAAYFGVRMQPGMSPPVASFSIREITDAEIFVPQIKDRLSELVEQIFEADSLDRRICVFQAYLNQIAPSQYSVDEKIRDILYLIGVSKGSAKMQDIAATICYSERHMNRMFHDAMGYSPKMFARITRFQNALGEMMTQGDAPVSHFMDQLSYADQAHFQREFKEFTGLTPKRFARIYQKDVCPGRVGVCP